MAITKLKGRQLSFLGAGAFTGSNGAANGVILDNGSGLILSASRIYLQANPEENLEAATKAYVDSQTGGGLPTRSIAFAQDDGSGTDGDPSFQFLTGSGEFSGGLFFGNSAFTEGGGDTPLTGSDHMARIRNGATMGAGSGSFAINQSRVFLSGSEMVSLVGTKNSVSNSVVIAATAAAGGIDIDAGTGGIAIDSTGAFSIDGAAASNITVATDSGAEDLTISVTGATDSSLILSSAGTGNDAVQVTASAGGMDITAAKAMDVTTSANNANITIDPHGTGTLALGSADNTAVTVDGKSFSIDAAGDASNITLATDGAAEDLTIAVTGATDSSLILSSTGTGADAVQVTASAGGMDITSALAMDITTSGGNSNITIDPNGTGTLALGSADNTAVTVDGKSFSIDAAGDASNITLTSDAAEEDLTIALAGATDSSLVLTSAGTGADAAQFTASAGGMDITSALAMDITTSGGNSNITIDPNGSGTLQLGSADNTKVDLDALKIDIDAASTAADAISIVSAGGVDITAAGNNGSVNIAATEESDFTVTSNEAGEHLTIELAGATDSSLILKSAGTDEDAIKIQATAGGIDVDAAEGGFNLRSAHSGSNAIVFNAAGGANASTLVQFGGNTLLAVDARGVSLTTNATLLADSCALVLTGASNLSLPKYFDNQATVVSSSATGATADLTNFGNVVAGNGILSASIVTSNGKSVGISLRTGSIRLLGQGGMSSNMIVPESLKIYQNGLLLTSGGKGFTGDYEIVHYNFLSSSGAGLDIKLTECPVGGDQFTVFCRSLMKGD